MKFPTRYFLPALAIVLMLTISRPAFVPSSAGAVQQTNREIVARVTVATYAERLRLATLGLDLLESNEGDDRFVLTTPAELEKLRSAGWKISVDDERTAQLRQSSADSFMGGYRTVPEMRAFADDMATRFPNLADVVVYGQSWEKISSGGTAGHDLFAVRLTNEQIAGPKPTILITASIHARELVPSEIALRLIEYLLNNYGADGDVTWLLDEHLIVIVPIANPDGRRLAEQGLMQRKNMNTSYGGGCPVPPTSTSQYGVDLNRNFNFKWGTVNTPTEPKCGQTYPGPTAASEPEAAGIQNMEATLFADQRGPLDTDPAPLTTTGVFIDLHSTGDLVMWPWAHNASTPPNAADLELIGRKFASFNGHTPQQSIDLYPSSGSTRDYAYGALGIAGFTFEIGLDFGTCGGFMPPFGCLDGGSGGSFWARNFPALIHAARIARTPYQLARGPAVDSLTSARGASAGIANLRAELNEQFSGGQQISAAEYYIDTPPWRGGTPLAMTALDGAFNATSEIAIASTAPLTGRHLLFVRAQDASGNWGPVRAVFTPGAVAPNTTDFDGDGKTDVAVFRPLDGGWYISQSSDDGFRAQAWGLSSDRLAPGDYDGDGKADLTVFRPSNGYWYVLESQTNALRAVAWGVSEDLPAPGDYDGDGKVDIAVFRPSQGAWYVLLSSSNELMARQFGIASDRPVQGDYDRDGKTDIAVYRNGQTAGASSAWYILQSSDSGFRSHAFGVAGDKPVPGDYDGDGKHDVAVFRPSNNNWYVMQTSSNILRGQAWGAAGDVPAPGDYDGDGRTDFGVFRPTSGSWYVLRSANGALLSKAWGTSGDIAIPSVGVQ
jgi:hypothetical protein